MAELLGLENNTVAVKKAVTLCNIKNVRLELIFPKLIKTEALHKNVFYMITPLEEKYILFKK